MPSLAGPVDLPEKTASEGLFDQAHAFADQRIAHVFTRSGVPGGFWRSVGHSHTAFFTESSMDELAAGLGGTRWHCVASCWRGRRAASRC